MTKTFETWRWKPGLVTWTFSVPGQAREDARANLERTTITVLDLVTPFGRVCHVEVVTDERGDDAFVFAGNDVARIGEAFSTQETIRRVVLTLDLAVNNGTETWLAGAARVYVEFPSLADEGGVGTDIEVWISLDVDIYGPVTWGKSRENSELARLNGPRLSAFLHMVRARLCARLVDIDEGDYEGHVNADGFM